MSLRRVVALVVLAIDTYVVFRVAPTIGMLGPVFYLVGALVGIGALGVLIFNLPLARRHQTTLQDDRSNEGYDRNSTVQRAASLVAILVLGLGPLFIAARGVYFGVLPSFLRPRGPEVTFSQTPGHFVVNLLAYAVLGFAVLFLVLRGRRAKSNSQRGTSVASRDRKV